jgi:hypothetical protein
VQNEGLQPGMTGNEERFLREITTRLPVSSIVEVQIFAPLRQGGVESGVAVVAATPVESDSGVAPADSPASERLQSRLAVHTARYRHTQKGVDRGKWEFEMEIEADAPLLAIDRVVSGVVQRSGEQNEPVRMSGADIRASIGDGDCTATT